MSMTKEEAKKHIVTWFYSLEDYELPPLQVTQALQVAISALRPITREQVEKVWRGEWIHAMPILGSGDEEIRCSKCGNIVGFETAFCPYCGSPITDKAVDMVMERLEALYEET